MKSSGNLMTVATAADDEPPRGVQSAGRRLSAALRLGVVLALVALAVAFYVVLTLGASTLVEVGLIAALAWVAISIVAVAICVASSRGNPAEHGTRRLRPVHGQRAQATGRGAVRGVSIWRSG